MTGRQWAELGYGLLGWPYLLWLLSARMFIGGWLPAGRVRDAVRTVFTEAKPFAPLLVIVWYLCRVYADWAAGRGGFNEPATWTLAVGMAGWWLVRHDDDDDDRWRRRRRRVAGRIRVTLGGRLAIDPGGAR